MRKGKKIKKTGEHILKVTSNIDDLSYIKGCIHAHFLYDIRENKWRPMRRSSFFLKWVQEDAWLFVKFDNRKFE